MTCNGIIAALPADTIVQIEDGLYAAPSERLLDRLRRVDHDIAGVLLIAHNPGLHSLATSLIGTGHDALREQLAAKFPTGALATLTLRGAWADLLPGSATLQAFVVPRALR
jgi:phosphohistidine phosphatase